MKRILPVLATLLAAFVALAAAAATGAASPAQGRQPRAVPAFHAIDLAGTVPAEVTIGKPARVEIVGEEALLDGVRTSVRDGVLVVDTRPKLAEHHHLRAIITVPDVSALTVSGTGAMTIAGVANDQLAIRLAGTGGLTASGTTGTLRVDLSGTGQLAADRLTARAVIADVSGVGAAQLRATQSAELTVSGTGSIALRGKPAVVKKSVTGVGAIAVE